MKRKNATRSALFMSIISVLLCVSMLVGTTFAWFTDEVQTGMNTIAAGNLDVELLANGDRVDAATKLFNLVDAQGKDTWWEPGMVVYENLQVANVGTLALKYQMALNFGHENDLKGHKLSEVLQVAVIDKIAPNATRAEVLAAAKASSQIGTLANFYLTGELEAGAVSTEQGIVIFWEPQDNAIDNLYNVNNKQQTSDGEPLHIEFGVNLQATQMMHEKDSFDETYDKNTEVYTVEEANARIAEGEDVALVGCIDPNGIIEIPAAYTGTVTLKNSTIKSVQAEANANIVILGNVTVNAKGTGATTFALTTPFDGSAIAANGKLSIIGNGTLIAVADDVNGAFGIGGMNATEVSIKGITIDYVSGSYAYGVGNDTKYYKDAPEGGAAIGSGKDGAVITLDDVTVHKAIGGSKAAGIGARYHVGVTVNITGSTIGYVEGGVSAAGIGGSRVSGNATESGTTINITGSTVTAKGGVYGAGIGSGYDTHCLSNQPLCTINITDSDINATGGQYAAGVGTGYHNAALAGEIKNSTVKAVSGEKVYKATYTAAMDVGFGVVDPTREGQQTDSKLIYNGVEINLNSAPASAMDNASMDAAIAAGKTEIVLGSGNFVIPASAQGKTLTIIGNGESTVAVTKVGTGGENCDYGLDGSTVTFENVTITTNSSTYIGYARCNGTYNNCTINGTYTLYGNSTFNNCTFNVSGDVYNVWTWGASTATFNNCTFNSDGKAMLLYGTVNTKLTMNNCVFNDNGDNTVTDKAAIEIGNDYGTSYELTVTDATVNGFAINPKGACTFTTLWANKNSMGTANLTVVVDGVEVYGPNNTNTVYISSADGLFAFANDVNVNGKTCSGKTVKLTADIDLENAAWTPIGQTGATEFKGVFDGQNHTIYNLNVDSSAQTGANYSSGLFGWAESGVTIKNVKIDGAKVVGNHNVAVIVGYTYSGKVDNCHVTNAEIVCNHANGDACGDKVGLIAGYSGDESRFTNCSGSDSTVKGGRDAGQLLGLGYNVSVSGCTATNVAVTATGECTGANVRNEIIGRVLG